MAIEAAAIPSGVLPAAHADDVAASHALTAIGAARSEFLRRALAGLADGRPDEYELHYAFAELYFLITRAWIAFARESSCPEFFHALIGEYFRLYQEHVYANIVDATGSSAAVQWAPYFAVAKQTDVRSRFYVRNIGLFFGARAHTRFDLRDAIVGAYRVHRSRGGPLPGAADLARELLGPSSSQLFSDVIRDYLVNVTAKLPVAPVTRRVAGWECRFLDPLWLGVFQGWRRRACCEAVERLAALRG